MALPVIHPEGKIDIHNRNKTFISTFNNLQSCPNLNPDNKKLIVSFINDCRLGKTVIGKSKKKIGVARCLKYITVLRRLSDYFKCSFNDVTQQDMERFINDLEADIYFSAKNKPYSSESKVDIKKTIKKFWKWKDGNNRHYPEIVEWIDTYVRIKEISALKREEIEQMIVSTTSTMLKAIIIVLFDSGARIEELLNVRLKPEHLQFKEDQGCYTIRLEFSKTKPRTISLPLSTSHIKSWLIEHPNKNNTQAQLFPIFYDNLRQHIHRIGKRALGKRVSPHLLRHSSVTYYANKINNRFKLCYRYGWAMSSKEVDRYLDREGLFEEELSEVVQKQDMTSLQIENSKLKDELAVLKSMEPNPPSTKNNTSHLLQMLINNQNRLSQALSELSGKQFDVILPVM